MAELDGLHTCTVKQIFFSFLFSVTYKKVVSYFLDKTMKYAIDYTFADNEILEAHEDMRKNQCRKDFIENILETTAGTLEIHESFETVTLDLEQTGGSLREKELIAVLSALTGLNGELRRRSEMSRIDYLKKAVLG